MMFHLFLATPEEVIFDDEVSDLKAPGAAGYFEILPQHAPFISSLKKGTLEFKDANNKVWVMEIPGGIFEVEHNNASVLADAVDLKNP